MFFIVMQELEIRKTHKDSLSTYICVRAGGELHVTLQDSPLASKQRILKRKVRRNTEI